MPFNYMGVQVFVVQYIFQAILLKMASLKHDFAPTLLKVMHFVVSTMRLKHALTECLTDHDLYISQSLLISATYWRL